MIHSLEDKTKRELIEICKIQVEEYQALNNRIAELEQENAELVEVIEHSGVDVDEILEAIKGDD